MATPRSILDHLSALLVATGARLRPCGYRRPLELEPIGGSDRLFELSIVGGGNTRHEWGAGRTSVDLDVAVRVAYSRLGGDAGGESHGGDRKSVNMRAGADTVLIQDTLESAININTLVTDIKEIRMLAGLSKDKDGRQN